MSKILVSVNSKEHLEEVLNKDIDGIILYIDKLSVNSSFYLDIDELKDIKTTKEVFVCINKLMHNDDLDELRRVMNILKDREERILFYDMAVYRIASELGMKDRLVIYQDHLNASILSNQFYYDLGIRGSFITNDITGEELLEIKRNSKMDIFFLGYGYQPIFYSRRYLVKNYLKYIEENSGNEYNIISDNGVEYPIKEEEFGTTIYSPGVINLVNYMDMLDEIDYIVLNEEKTEHDKFMEVIDKFIKREKTQEDTYLGFFKVKTIYKVK